MMDWHHGKNLLNVSDTLIEWLLLTLFNKLEAELLELRTKMGIRQSSTERGVGGVLLAAAQERKAG